MFTAAAAAACALKKEKKKKNLQFINYKDRVFSIKVTALCNTSKFSAYTVHVHIFPLKSIYIYFKEGYLSIKLTR